MADTVAQLIVVSGPDEGRSAALAGEALVVGRAVTCELALTEQYVSREHARLRLSADGVVLEVLSSRGVEIDGRTHKRGKVIILATGDVVTVGLEDRLLFVDRGADAAAAVAKWQSQQKAAPPPAPAPVKAPEPVAAAAVKARPAAPAPAFAARKPFAAAAPAGSAAAGPSTAPAPRSRLGRRVLLIGLGVYGAAVVVLVVVLALLPDKPARQTAKPPRLTGPQIRKALMEDKSPPALDAEKAVAALEEAHRFYQAGQANIASRYNCIRQYKLYKAYSGRAAFEDPADQAHFEECLDELVRELLPIYDDACNAAEQERWHQALQGFEKARQRVLDQSNPFNFNVLSHIACTKKQIDAQNKSKRQFLGE
jgi:predicted component of type VI protein secretion system